MRKRNGPVRPVRRKAVPPSTRAIVLSPQPIASRSAVLLVRVVEATSGEPLPNAEIIDPDAASHRFTNGDGESRIAWPDRRSLHLRVRQLGFQVEDREVTRPAVPDAVLDTATFALARVACPLPASTTRATTHCATDGDPAPKALAAVAPGVLRMSVECYERGRRGLEGTGHGAVAPAPERDLSQTQAAAG